MPYGPACAARAAKAARGAVLASVAAGAVRHNLLARRQRGRYFLAYGIP